MRPSAIDRLLSNIKVQGDCWIWQASRRGQYGAFFAWGKRMGAHQFSWRWYKNDSQEIPPKMEVTHSCDTPLCVNPDHLSLKTHIENMHERDERGRQNPIIGTDHPNAKLNPDKVGEIRKDLARGVSCKELGRKHHVKPMAIYQILYGISWRHVTD